MTCCATTRPSWHALRKAPPTGVPPGRGCGNLKHTALSSTAGSAADGIEGARAVARQLVPEDLFLQPAEPVRFQAVLQHRDDCLAAGVGRLLLAPGQVQGDDPQRVQSGIYLARRTSERRVQVRDGLTVPAGADERLGVSGC